MARDGVFWLQIVASLRRDATSIRGGWPLQIHLWIDTSAKQRVAGPKSNLTTLFCPAGGLLELQPDCDRSQQAEYQVGQECDLIQGPIQVGLRMLQAYHSCWQEPRG